MPLSLVRKLFTEQNVSHRCPAISSDVAPFATAAERQDVAILET